MEDKYVAILMEEMNSKFELVLEGHQVLRSDMRRMEETLSKKIDENTTRIKINTEAIAALDKKLSKRIDEVDEKLSKRIDAVGADLKAHRADTEAHHGIYQVRESSTYKE
ncbi:MAG: hypothetical protein KAW01_01810 [Deltaproteobacteria bacterium]|nr:hypothetical protein [Deltaproteobacteria bacterium]